MVETFREVLELLEQYFVYIYPGFITIMINHFTKARGTNLNKSTLGISIVISYVYIILYQYFFKINVSKFSD